MSVWTLITVFHSTGFSLNNLKVQCCIGVLLLS